MKKKGSSSQKEEHIDESNTEKNEELKKEEVSEAVAGEKEMPDGSDKDVIIADQKKKVEELNDKFLRLYAEFENYRKRTSKERLELIKTASSEVVSSMLPVLDDFERAINAFPDDENVKSLKDGIVLIYEKYKAVLVRAGLEEIKAMGETFNTDIHEAIASVNAANDEQKGKVIDVTEKGYYLNGVVLRFAKVVVAN